MPDLTISEAIVCGAVSALLLGVIVWAFLGGFDAPGLGGPSAMSMYLKGRFWLSVVLGIIGMGILKQWAPGRLMDLVGVLLLLAAGMIVGALADEEDPL